MSCRVVWTLFVVWAAFLPEPARAQFESRAALPLGESVPYSAIVGDFNGDGILDAAVPNTLSGVVQILLGNGDGTFRIGGVYPASAAFYGATASLRNNGVLDIVLGSAGSDDIYVMLGNGDGTFQIAVPYPTTAHAHMIALGDFTGSGQIDVADLEGSSDQGVLCNCVEVLPGRGDGTFGPPVSTTPVPYNIDGFAIAVGDFGGNGVLDLAVGGGFFAANQVDILLGNGDGTFTADGFYPVGATPSSIATGYFSGDRAKLDLAVSNGGAVAVLLGNGDGTFEQAVTYTATGASWVVAQDLNGHGLVDLAASDSGEIGVQPPGVNVLKGNGDGTFQREVFYPAGSRADDYYVAAGDFNGDGKPDLLLVDLLAAQVITLLNTGTVNFSPSTPLGFPGQVVGTTSGARTVTLTNSGSTRLEVKSVRASSEFEVKSTCGASVAPGASCKISVRFSPTKQGVKHGTVEIIDSASSKAQVIELSGTGT